MPDTQTIHASCIAINHTAILLLGESGSGKSDLALRLIDSGAVLVGDDQIVLRKEGNSLLAAPAPRLEGLLEVRGVGIVTLPYIQNIPLALAVNLVAPHETERMPKPQFFDCLAVQVPLLSLHAFEQSTPAKIRLFLSHPPQM